MVKKKLLEKIEAQSSKPMNWGAARCLAIKKTKKWASPTRRVHAHLRDCSGGESMGQLFWGLWVAEISYPLPSLI